MSPALPLFEWIAQRSSSAKSIVAFPPHDHLRIEHFADGTGRGVACTRDIAAGEPLVSVPAQWLITAHYVAHEHPILSAMRAHLGPPLTALDKLCLFLLVERCRRLRDGEQGLQSSQVEPSLDRHDWSGYLESIPRSFCIPPCYSRVELECVERCLLSSDCTRRLRELLSEYEGAYDRINELAVQHFPDWLRHTLCDPSTGNLSRALVQWAFCAVNTRCVCLMKRDPHDAEKLLSAEHDSNVALVPLLDMLNHSPHCSVSMRYDEQKDSFEIVADAALSRGEQVFISYGPHSNHTLLLDYGFAVQDNPQNSFCFDDAVQQWVDAQCTLGNGDDDDDDDNGDNDDDDGDEILWNNRAQLRRNIQAIRKCGLWGQFIATLDEGVGWRMATALRLLCMDHAEWCNTKNWEFCVRSDRVMSAANETRARQLMLTLAESLLEQSRQTLPRDVLGEDNPLVHPVEQVQREEQEILECVVEQCHRILSVMSMAAEEEQEQEMEPVPRANRKRHRSRAGKVVQRGRGAGKGSSGAAGRRRRGRRQRT